MLAGIAMGPAPAATAAGLSSILFVNPLPKYPAWRLIGDCLASRAKELEIPVTESGPTGGALDATVMIQQIQQGIANKVGAIATFPATNGFVPVLQQAGKAGIRVGTFYGAAGTESGSGVNIGANFERVGEIFAEAIARRPGPQKVGLMAQGPSGAAKAFVDAFTAAAAKTANVTVTAVVYTNDDASKALDQASTLLTAHPDVNVIASHMGTATQGAVAAIKSKGLVGKVVFVANGIAGGGEQGLKDGTVYTLMLQDLCTAGSSMADSLAALALGKPVPAQIDVGVRMFGADDYKDYLAKGWQ
ncbi:sugar ABC transporter substrate-binding protein [Labrys wisconsinensis]|uniref:ABC-type sugar transport system substrate-binding protein n=1 Tax=Labrys wisconsinensis TaxID=425677 RepID=A0ABU0JIM0_9HYPH|nr:sugar ABC transporter substrate-binding protein [Labrys wisconsinensis]MDQ0474094.1 ABC-type sugar transport system substrate-binding protein [Labrys wisconsinensis]